jgi:transposase
MHATTIAVDLAKDVFEIVGTTRDARITERRRLSRRQFERFLDGCPVGTEVVMEACGTAHYWGRECHRRGLVAHLLPPQYVRAYVRRNKTDRTDAEALLEARRCAGLHPVPVKSTEQQALQALHTVRAHWQRARISRLNALRGLLREQGLALPAGAKAVYRRVPAILDDEAVALPSVLRTVIRAVLEELRDLDTRLGRIDHQLRTIADAAPDAQRLQTIPGIGPIVATSLLGAVPHIHAFPSGRHFASWLGLTPREVASGSRRWLGGITKRGDVYVRTMLTHGARSVLLNAHRRARAQRHELSPLQRWANDVAARRGYNTAVIAVANKLARIIWAVWRSEQSYTTSRVAA